MASSFLGTTTRRATRRAILVEDEGLASLADMEAGFSGNKNTLFSTSSRRRPSCRAFPSPPSSSFRSGLVYEETHHFLDSCSLCKKPLGGNRDIFMYRGNTPFCSEACRQEQMDIDDAEEKKWSLSRKATSRIEQQQKTPSSKAKNQELHVRAGTVVAG